MADKDYPHLKIYDKTISPERCVAHVTRDMGRWTQFGQCWNKPSQTVDSYKVCGTHAKQIERSKIASGEIKVEEKFIYTAGYKRYSRNVSIGIAEVIGETAQYYEVRRAKGLWAYERKVLKSKAETDLAKFLIKLKGMLEQHIESLHTQIEDSYNDLSSVQEAIDTESDDKRHAIVEGFI
jgi:hypothetical protein